MKKREEGDDASLRIWNHRAAQEEELARMLAGHTITQEARKAAQKLLEPAA